MPEIIATRTQLRLDDHLIELPTTSMPQGIFYEVGVYPNGGPPQFLWEMAERLGRERGIEFGYLCTGGPMDNLVFFYVPKGKTLDSPEVRSIPLAEVEARMERYATFLRIQPRECVSLVEKINAFDLPDLRALIATIPPMAHRGPADPIQVGVEIALGETYTIHLTY